MVKKNKKVDRKKVKKVKPVKNESSLFLDLDDEFLLSDSNFFDLTELEGEKSDLDDSLNDDSDLLNDYLNPKTSNNANAKLKSILEITRIMSSINEPEKLFNLILEKIIELSRADKGAVILTGSDRTLEFKSFVNYSESEKLHIDELISKTVIFNVYENKKAVILKDVVNADDYSDKESVMRLNVRSIICVPMLFKEVCIGVIYLDDRKVNKFTDDDLELFEIFAGQAAVSINNMTLINQINRHNEELESLVSMRTDQLIKAEKKIARQEKMAGLVHIASGIAHYFNNMITGIIGNTDLLKMQGVKHTKQLNEIIKISQNLSRFISSLQNFSSPGNKERISIDLVEVIDNLLLLKQEECSVKNIKLVTNKFDKKTILINANKFDLVHAFMNVLSNSVESFENLERKEKRIEIILNEENGFVQLFIKDNGCGIKKENLSSIFNPFFTTKGSISEGEHLGFGMGLSTGQKLIVDNGGGMSVESEEGLGTVVKIEFAVIGGEELLI